MDDLRSSPPRSAQYTERDRGSAPGIGGASIIMIFAVLCLTVFAALNLLSADSELKLSNRYAASVSDYYDADSLGVEFVANVLNIAGGGSSAEEYAEAAKSLGAEAYTDGETAYITNDIPSGSNQTLHTEFSITYGNVDIITWQLIYTGEWNAGDGFGGFDLWIGG